MRGPHTGRGALKGPRPRAPCRTSTDLEPELELQEPELEPGGISPLQQMVASGAGAVVTSLFMTPLDVVKVRLQSQRPSVPSELTPPT